MDGLDIFGPKLEKTGKGSSKPVLVGCRILEPYANKRQTRIIPSRGVTTSLFSRNVYFLWSTWSTWSWLSTDEMDLWRGVWGCSCASAQNEEEEDLTFVVPLTFHARASQGALTALSQGTKTKIAPAFMINA